MNTRIHIFCDGGIGNRINALISGLALADRFALHSTVYWPKNSWCGAAFSDIFQNVLDVRTDALNDLAGKFGHAKIMLHDEIGAQFLQVPFASAYDYQSLDDFEHRGLPANGDLFFYPAVIPQWIPENLIHESLRRMRFSQHITQCVSDFINQKLMRPFQGLHLRRTDLRVGLTDPELMAIVQGNPQEVFFVCSDDPQAEALAGAHPNVHARAKAHHVEKMVADADWISLSKDHEGRSSYGNIQRSRDAMIEGTIDLLILAHSQIVGFSGSTFQRMARLLGEAAPLVQIARPPALPFFSFTEMTQQIERQLIDPGVLLQVCQTMMQNGQTGQALDLMRLGFERMSDAHRHDIAHTLGVMLLNQNHPRQAKLYLDLVLNKNHQLYSTRLHLAYAEVLLGNDETAATLLYRSAYDKPLQINSNDALLEAALVKKLSV
jgi:hypothetical protein